MRRREGGNVFLRKISQEPTSFTVLQYHFKLSFDADKKIVNGSIAL